MLNFVRFPIEWRIAGDPTETMMGPAYAAAFAIIDLAFMVQSGGDDNDDDGEDDDYDDGDEDGAYVDNNDYGNYS